MSTSPLETKLSNLQAEVRGVHEKQCWENFPRNSHESRSSTRPSRPNKLGDMGGTHTPRSRPTNLSVAFPQPENQNSKEIESKLQEIMKLNGLITIDGERYQTSISQMVDLGELGNGTCGHVVKMRHTPSNTVIAVKQMRRSGNPDENKRIIMDIDVVLKSHGCDYIVKCLGCFMTDADVWICMELMATCFEKLLKTYQKPVPEEILGKVTVATVKALNYLKEEHGVIHRDVKPSNILLDEKGRVKLCDFGISGRLVDSKAKTRSAGCAAYMAPERIDPPDPSKPDYDIRADVWSLGITLVELATGEFPYQDCNTDFEVLTKVLQDDPPSLPEDKGFSLEFRNFVKLCLTKNYKDRPKYPKLLEEAFIKKYEAAHVDVADWYAQLTRRSATTTTQGTQATQATQATTVSTATSPTLPHSVALAAIPAPAPAPAPSTPQQRRLSSTQTPTPTPTPPSPSVRRSVWHYPQHVRSISETGRPMYPPVLPQHINAYQMNGDAVPLSNGRCSPYSSTATGWAGAETEATATTTATVGGRFSPFHSSRLSNAVDGGAVTVAAVNALRSSPAPVPVPAPVPAPASPAHASWQAQEALAEWNAHTPPHRYGAAVSSPHTGRKRFPSEPPPSTYRDHYHPGNTSPLVLQRYYHQQQQHLQQQQQQQLHHHLHHHHHHHHHIHHHHNSYPTPPSHLSPSHHLPIEIETKKVDEPASNTGSGSGSASGKKRFASFLKFNPGGGGGGNGGGSSAGSVTSSNASGAGGLPPQRPSRHASPGPPPPSPDPSPCFTRLMASGDGMANVSSSTLGRRGYLDVSPVRRDVVQGSPSLARRFISPTPPQPPPRRLSTEGGGGTHSGPSSLTLPGSLQGSGTGVGTSSVPGSPQVRRGNVENGRSRYHYTPQPQRRGLGGNVDFHDL